MNSNHGMSAPSGLVRSGAAPAGWFLMGPAQRLGVASHTHPAPTGLLWARWLVGATCLWWALLGSSMAQTVISTAPRAVAPAPEAVSMPARVGRIAAVLGGAQLWDASERQWVPALLNRPVTAGDRLRSEREARVEIQVGSLGLFLGPNTEVELVRLDDQGVQAKLMQGHVVARVRTAEWARDLLLLTDELQAQALEPGLYRVDRDQVSGGRSAVAALRGAARLLAAEMQVQLGRGQRLEVLGRGAGAAMRNTGLLQDSFAVWMNNRDQAPDPSTSWSLVSPEMTGVDKLDQYGQWENHPEAGWVWAPQVVRAGWEPFRDGRWVWVAPWGWTWVDDTPWGFAPSHYGRWFQWNSRWVWSPGHGRQHRPVYSPAIGHWGQGGHIVWRSTTPPPRHHWHPGSAAVPVVPIVPGDRLNGNPVIIIDGHRHGRDDHRGDDRRWNRDDRRVDEPRWGRDDRRGDDRRGDRDDRRGDDRRGDRDGGGRAGRDQPPPTPAAPAIPITPPPVSAVPALPVGEPAVRILPDRRHGFERPERTDRQDRGDRPVPPERMARPDRGGEAPVMPPRRESPAPVERPAVQDRAERQRQAAQ